VAIRRISTQAIQFFDQDHITFSILTRNRLNPSLCIWLPEILSEKIRLALTPALGCAVERKVELVAKISVFTSKLGILNLANYKSASQ
jgi:hypothetical protein